MTKIKPQWMTSYATRHKRQTYGGTSGHARYGGGTTGNRTDIKSSTGYHTRDTADTPITMSSANFSRNYSRLDDDIEKAIRMPVPLSPTYKKSDSSSSDSGSIFGNGVPRSAGDQDGVQMQQLQPRPKQSRKASDNDKAMEILGVGLSTVGVSTQVVGGKSPAPSSQSGDVLRGIEVKRDVYVSSTPISER